MFGQVMGLVAVTLGFLALGAYIGRDLSGGLGVLFFVAAFACIFGLMVPIAASIFLDVLNVFLFLLQIFGRD